MWFCIGSTTIPTSGIPFPLSMIYNKFRYESHQPTVHIDPAPYVQMTSVLRGFSTLMTESSNVATGDLANKSSITKLCFHYWALMVGST